jgi:hypothetical protein
VVAACDGQEGGSRDHSRWGANRFCLIFYFLQKYLPKTQIVHTANICRELAGLVSAKSLFGGRILPKVAHGKAFAERKPTFAVSIGLTANVPFPEVLMGKSDPESYSHYTLHVGL